jgi:hypothetical protein
VRPADSARKELEDVQCRLVRPVQVFEHDDAGLLELVHERRDHLVRGWTRPEQALELAAYDPGDVEEGAQMFKASGVD